MHLNIPSSKLCVRCLGSNLKKTLLEYGRDRKIPLKCTQETVGCIKTVVYEQECDISSNLHMHFSLSGLCHKRISSTIYRGVIRRVVPTLCTLECLWASIDGPWWHEIVILVHCHTGYIVILVIQTIVILKAVGAMIEKNFLKMCLQGLI